MTATIVRLAARRPPAEEAERLQRELDELHGANARLLLALALARASADRVELLLATLALAGWGVALWTR
jgi:hypothetical protein